MTNPYRDCADVRHSSLSTSAPVARPRWGRFFGAIYWLPLGMNFVILDVGPC